MLFGGELDRFRDILVDTAQLRHDRGDFRCLSAERFAKLRLVDHTQGTVEAFDEGNEGLGRLRVLAVSLEEQETSLSRLFQKLFGKPRFADPGLPANQNQASATHLR